MNEAIYHFAYVFKSRVRGRGCATYVSWIKSGNEWVVDKGGPWCTKRNNKVCKVFSRFKRFWGFIVGGRFFLYFLEVFFLISPWAKKPVGGRKFLGFYEAEVPPLLAKPILPFFKLSFCVCGSVWLLGFGRIWRSSSHGSTGISSPPYSPPFSPCLRPSLYAYGYLYMWVCMIRNRSLPGGIGAS